MAAIGFSGKVIIRRSKNSSPRKKKKLINYNKRVDSTRVQNRYGMGECRVIEGRRIIRLQKINIVFSRAPRQKRTHPDGDDWYGWKEKSNNKNAENRILSATNVVKKK